MADFDPHAAARTAEQEAEEAAAFMGVEFPVLTRGALARTTGFLHKKGGAKGGMRRNWKRRFFVLQINLRSWDENYELQYLDRPGDLKPLGVAPLHQCALELGGTKEKRNNADAVFEFRLEFPDAPQERKPLEMYAETEEERDDWCQTLRAAIEVARERAELQADFIEQQRAKEAEQNENQAQTQDDWGDARAHEAVLRGGADGDVFGFEQEDDEADEFESKDAVARRNAEMRAMEEERAREAVRMAEMQDAPVRVMSSLKVPGDVSALPTGSPARGEFDAAFRRDVATALGIGDEFVSVTRLRAGIIVDYEVAAVSADRQYAIEDMTALFQLLKHKVVDHASDLYMGVLTARADTAYQPVFKCRYAPDVEHRRKLEERARQLVGIPLRPQPVGMHGASPDERVARVLAKYRGRALPYNTVDLSHVYVTIVFEGIERPLRVPNPRMYRQRHCVVWDHEVMTALGVTGSLQDRWLRAVALVPHDPAALTLVFEESPLHGGHRVVNTALFESGQTYDVEVEDRRQEALAGLTDAQRQAIVHNFSEYDADGSGALSREELFTEVQLRTVYRKQQVMQQFDEYLRDHPERRERAEELLQQHTQRFDDAERQLLDMFERADVDGDGELTLDEFSLAEAWWLTSTINPDSVKLF